MTYADLTDSQKEIIKRTRRRLHDEESSPWFEEGDEAYADMLVSVVADINLSPPVITSFYVVNMPIFWTPVAELGLTIEAIQVRISQWIESPRLQGFSGPFADHSDFYQRWQARLQQIEPKYKTAKKQLKVAAHLPKGGVGSVDRYSNWYGRTASEVPFFRGLPSWFIGR